MDAAIFGCNATTLLCCHRRGRSTVPLTRGAGICRFPFPAASFVMVCSLSSPVRLWIPLAVKKSRNQKKLRLLSCCTISISIQEPTKERRSIDARFWLEKKWGIFSRLPLRIRECVKIQVMEGWWVLWFVEEARKYCTVGWGGSKHMPKWNLILCLTTSSMGLIMRAGKGLQLYVTTYSVPTTSRWLKIILHGLHEFSVHAST